MAADFKTGGLKAVHYSDDGTSGSWTGITGEIVDTNNLPVEAITQETTNSEYQSGDTAHPEITFTDHEDFLAMRDLAVGSGRAKKYWVLEFFDGRLIKTKQAIYPKVVDQPTGKRSDGDSKWMLSFTLNATQAYKEITSLT